MDNGSACDCVLQTLVFVQDLRVRSSAGPLALPSGLTGCCSFFEAARFAGRKLLRGAVEAAGLPHAPRGPRSSTAAQPFFLLARGLLRGEWLRAGCL